MTALTDAELREHARKVAAELPPVDAETRERLAALLRPGIKAGGKRKTATVTAISTAVDQEAAA